MPGMMVGMEPEGQKNLAPHNLQRTQVERVVRRRWLEGANSGLRLKNI